MASKISAFEETKIAIEGKKNFILEAGAGSGKTYTLIQVISYLTNKKFKNQQKILCITYTNVAKDEVIKRLKSTSILDRVDVFTMHDFLWDFFSSFQIELRKEVRKLAQTKKLDLENEISEAKRKLENPRKNTNIMKQEEIIESNSKRIEKYLDIDYDNLDIKYDVYSAYYRGVISHNDIILIAKSFFLNSFFIKLFVSAYPYVLIDEYQDTDTELITNIIEGIAREGMSNKIVVGLFGDKMQQIYDNKGELNFSLFDKTIMKIDNYRSSEAIIHANNILRDDSLKQSGECQNNKVKFDKLLFIYNSSDDVNLKKYLNSDFDKYKRLYLSNGNIAKEVGFLRLSELFNCKYKQNANEKLLKLDDALLNFIIRNVIEKVKQYKNKEYNYLIKLCRVKCIKELEIVKSALDTIFDDLESTLASFLIEYKKILYFDTDKYNKLIESYDDDIFIEALLKIPVKEYLNLLKQIDNETTLGTMHGVKGAEFKNVIVNIFEKQKWTKYDFDSVLLNLEKNKSSIHAAHRLLYVSCTRAEEALIINYIVENYSKEHDELLNKKILKVFGENIEYVVLK